MGNPFTTTITNVLLVESLTHNLLSIRHLCDEGYAITFTTPECTLSHVSDKQKVFTGFRTDNIYMLDLGDNHHLELNAS